MTCQRAGRKDETLGLITDLGAEELAPRRWLQANRQGCGIENGTRQRLDVALNDDRCRVRSPNGLWILGMVRRLVMSLFMGWRGRQAKPRWAKRI